MGTECKEKKEMAASWRQKNNRRMRVRTMVQITAALFVFSMVFFRYAPDLGILAPESWPYLQGFCPISMVETAGGLLVGQVPAADRSNLFLLVGAIALAVFAGALFCGWLCPLGSVQQWFGRIGRRLFGKRYNRFVPRRLDRVLGYGRYLVLALVLIQAVRYIGFVAATFNPARALMHVWVGGAFAAGLAVLGVTLVASLFIERPWCRWLCPFGAVQGVVARISPWTIRRRAESCLACGKCSRACPMAIPVDRMSAVRDGRCNRCTVCVAVCPVPGALDYANRCDPRTGTGGRAAGHISLSGGAAAAMLAVGLFFLPVTLARATRVYLPAGLQVSATLGPEDIAPTMTLAEVADGLGLSLSELLETLGVDVGFDVETRIFDIEEDERYEHITVNWVRRVLSDTETR